MNDRDDFSGSGYEDILKIIMQLAEGDYSARGPVSNRSDNIDAIITSLNMLAEELSARETGEGTDDG